LSKVTGDLIPQNLIPAYFSAKLPDGSLLIGFHNSRFHSHIYQDGNTLVAHVTENVKGGKRIHTERIKVEFSLGSSILSLFKKKELTLPGDATALFLSRDSLILAMERVVNGAAPSRVRDAVQSILASEIDLSNPSAAASSVSLQKVIDLLRLLAEWGHEETGVLPRYTLDEARRQYPPHSPCFVELDGKCALVHLSKKGVLMYPQQSLSEGLSIVLKLSRMERLIAAPIDVRGREVLMNEELMRQLKAEYEKRMASERKQP
jgi:hypothetical protein